MRSLPSIFGPLAGCALFLAAACSDDSNFAQPNTSDLSCSIPSSQIFNGGPGKDGIPALNNPTFVQTNEGGLEYLTPNDRVVGIVIDEQAFAIPLNIFWWHEIVNMEVGDTKLAVTHCPLTGSSMFPVIETTWAGWLTLHPGTDVVSSDTGWDRDYQRYPYGAYDSPDNANVLFDQVVNTTRPPKERALGVPLGSGGVVFPFGVLDEMGPVAAAPTGLLGEELVVFWDRERDAAMAYYPTADGQDLTFSIAGGEVFDDQTRSIWRVDGLSVGGPLAGTRLEPVADAFIGFWFAWPAFYPEIEVWTP